MLLHEKYRRRASAWRMALAACLSLPTAASALDTPLQLVRDLPRTDVAVAGVGGIGAAAINGGGEGTLALAGVSGEVRSAWLYWHGIDWDAAGSGFVGGDGNYDEASIEFDGRDLTGTRIAQQASNNCWPSQAANGESAAVYVADVSAIVRARGNGDYDFAGLADGAGHSANGMSLIVYYDDGDPANDWRVREYAGAEDNPWEPSILFEYQGGEVELVLHVADGQSGLFDGASRFTLEPPAPGQSAQYEFQRMLDNDWPWPGNSVPLMPTEHRRNTNGLWDIRRFPVGGLFRALRRYHVEVNDRGPESDCYSLLVLQVLEHPTRRSPSIEPNPYDFGDVPGGTQSAPQTFTVTNTMDVPVVLGSATTVATWFTILGNSCNGQTLPPGGQCSVELACTPTAASRSIETGRLTLPWETDTPNRMDGNFIAELDCASHLLPTYSSVAMEPPELDFGPVELGEYSPARSAVLRNTGNLPITVLEVQEPISGFMRAASVPCPAGTVLAPGAQCTLTINYFADGSPESTHASELLVLFRASDDSSDRVRLRLFAINGGGDRVFADGFETTP